MENLRRTQSPTIEPARGLEGADRPDRQPLELDAAAVSHPGKRRLNQDQHLIANLAAARRRDEVRPAADPDADELLLIVADGMGGHPRGEVASLLAVRVLVKELLRWPVDAGEPLRRLRLAVRLCDESLHRAGARRADLSSMGTTLTAAWWIPPMLYLAHVGDSRLYLSREGRLSRLTKDQTVAANLVASGLEPEKTRGFEHVLTQAVGGGEKGVDPETGCRRLQPDDALLLCTNGLVRGVTDEEIARALRLADCARTAAVALLEGALATDDGDNITAVAARVRPASRRGGPVAARV
jgi:protein phosphatase